MLGDRELYDRAILRGGGERESDLFGRDLHRIERVLGDSTSAHEGGARPDGDDHEADGKRAHRVRRRSAEQFKNDGEPIAKGGRMRMQPEKDARPNSAAGPEAT